MLYCTLLAQAQSQDEREKIEDKMQSDPKLSVILHALWETTAAEGGESAAGSSSSRREKQMEHSGCEGFKFSNLQFKGAYYATRGLPT